MKDIFYNSAVAKRCGNNGIIKAILLNYIYNYHKRNPRKGVGHPAQVSLREFVYQYTVEEKSLWKRSFIHRILKDLKKDGHLVVTLENKMPFYSVSTEIAGMLSDENGQWVSFDLELACEYGIHIAIMSRYLLHVIEKSPDGIAYNLSVDEMAEINRISPAQIYRAIKHLVETQVLSRVKMSSKRFYRALALMKYNPTRGEIHNSISIKGMPT